MPEKLATYQLNPDKMVCPYCEAHFEGASPITPGQPQGFKKGLITVCYHCAGAMIMGDANFKPLLPGDIAKLPTATQKQLELAQEMVKRQNRKNAPPQN